MEKGMKQYKDILSSQDNAHTVALHIKSRYALSLTGKYVKQALTALEQCDRLDPITRKIVLDAFGDMRRDLEKTLI